MRKIGLFAIIGAISVVLAFGSSAFAADKINWRMGSTWTPAINLYRR
ncbi:MAG: hypothetical protein JSW39_21720 [Desulfobacterales bacterium]|nr:MAG: hypothetical protein JSW39_21720 [Desulfobacterales bacterium]